MARVVGIICEYNPFHNGHKYQINKIREIENDATVVAIMSGNVVQRGEFAMLNKYDRAKIALENGVNAVFELPYPYSASTAEIFASAGVELAARLGCDCLYFGTEQQSIQAIEKIAEIVDTPEFDAELKDAISNKNDSFIEAKANALKKIGVELPKSANDMLAVEYVRAIKKKGLNLEYRSIQRVGAFYNDQSIGDLMSASAIRKQFYENNILLSVPSLPIYNEIIDFEKYLNVDIVNRYLQSFVLLNFDKKIKSFDTALEMVSLIYERAKNSCSGDEFINSLSSKAFTTARLKRAILYALFDIEKVDFTPKYTILLGMDKIGRSHLNKIKKQTKIFIITKHSDGKSLNRKIKKQLEKSYTVDALYNTFLKKPSPPCEAYKNKPIIKK